MAICSKCGVEISENEIYKVKDDVVCEDCMIKYTSPPKACGGGPGGAQPS
jgi:hypothetical protein